METFLLTIHVTVCLFLIFIVLVQGGKGAEMGAAFGGGSSQTLFGGRGAATFLGKLTTAIAILFMVTSLVLSMVAIKGGDTSGINLDSPAPVQSPISTDLPAPSVINPPVSDQETAPQDAPLQPMAPPATTGDKGN